jgi:hypothetical protein
MPFDILGLTGVILAVFVPLFIKFEHRLTKLEANDKTMERKIDQLLNHNGIDPKESERK